MRQVLLTLCIALSGTPLHIQAHILDGLESKLSRDIQSQDGRLKLVAYDTK